MMKLKMSLIALSLSLLTSFDGAQTADHRTDSSLVRNVFSEVLAHGEAHENLRILCKEIGHRLSGSPSACLLYTSPSPRDLG